MKIPVYYVGFLGHHRTGKSTVADVLCAELEQFEGIAVARVNMADPLRETLEEALPNLLDPHCKKHELERSALQYAGEIWRRQNKNVWIQQFLNTVDEYLHCAQQNSAQALLVLVADIYNHNELTLMDHLVLVRHAQHSHGMYEYMPETIRQTSWALDHPFVVRELLQGTLQPFVVSSPEELSSAETVNALRDAIWQGINNKLTGLGHEPLEVRHLTSLGGMSYEAPDFRAALGTPAVPQ
jgi:hypothetical protein